MSWGARLSSRGEEKSRGKISVARGDIHTKCITFASKKEEWKKKSTPIGRKT